MRRLSGIFCVLAALVAATPSLPCILLCLSHEVTGHDMAHGPHGPASELPCHGTHLTTQTASAVQGLAGTAMLPSLAAAIPNVPTTPPAESATPARPRITFLQALDPPPPRLS